MRTRVVRQWIEPNSKHVYRVQKWVYDTWIDLAYSPASDRPLSVPSQRWDWSTHSSYDDRDEAETVAARLADNIDVGNSVVAEFGSQE